MPPRVSDSAGPSRPSGSRKRAASLGSSGDEAYDPEARRAPAKPRASRKSAASSPKRDLSTLPTETLAHIFSLCDPPDLLALARTNKHLRSILLSRSNGRPIWMASLRRQYTLGLPEPPLKVVGQEQLSEPAYVALVYSSLACCSHCGDRKGAASMDVEWLWCSRFCAACHTSKTCWIDPSAPRIVPKHASSDEYLVEHRDHAQALADAVKDSDSTTLVRSVYDELASVARQREADAIRLASRVGAYLILWHAHYSSTISVDSCRVSRQLFKRNQDFIDEHLAELYSSELCQFYAKMCSRDTQSTAAAAALRRELPSARALSMLCKILDVAVERRRKAVTKRRVLALKQALDDEYRTTRRRELAPSLGDFATFTPRAKILSRQVSDHNVVRYLNATPPPVLLTDAVKAIEARADDIETWRKETIAYLAGLVRGTFESGEPEDDVALLRTPSALFQCSRCNRDEALSYPTLSGHSCFNDPATDVTELRLGRRSVRACIRAIPSSQRQIIPALLKAVRPSKFATAADLAAAGAVFFVDPTAQPANDLRTPELDKFCPHSFSLGVFLKQAALFNFEHVPYARISINNVNGEPSLAQMDFYGCAVTGCHLPLSANPDKVWLHRLRVHGWAEHANQDKILKLRMRRPT